MCPHSRTVTVPEHADKVATPVVVKNVERTWAKRTSRGMTAMGVRFVEDAECVGVLLPVTASELARFDKREVGYDRIQIDLDVVEPVPFLDDEHYKHEAHSVFLNAKDEKDSECISIWMYVPQQVLPPTPEHPIVQSYVDTILRGCLYISEDFAKEFIASTKGWAPEEIAEISDSEDEDDELIVDDTAYSGDKSVWVDDRHDPIYIRGDKEWSLKKAQELDRLLRKYRPQHLENRLQLNRRKAPRQ